MFCPNCGNRVEEGEEFCGFCGARIVGTPENEEYARNGAEKYDNAADEKETGRKRKGIKVILPLILVTFIATFAWVKKDSLSPLLEKINQKIVSYLPEKETKGDAGEDSGDWEKQINRKENWIDHSGYIDSSAQISSSDMDTLKNYGEMYLDQNYETALPYDLYDADDLSIICMDYVGCSFWKAKDNISNPWNIIFLYYEVTAATNGDGVTYYSVVPIGNLEKRKDGSINLGEDRLVATHLICVGRNTLEELQDHIQESVGNYYSMN